MHWCLGMRSSGSTWIFNVVRKVAAVMAPDRSILAPYVVLGSELPDLPDPAHLIIVKSHETDEIAAAALHKHADVIWISVRDPRDCVASLVQHHQVEFGAALEQVRRDARYCVRFVSDRKARLFRYESGFIDNPTTVGRIAAGFGGVLSVADRDRIFAETRRPVIEAFIRQLDRLPTTCRPAPNDLVDLVTQWHSHHANRTGESGRWRSLLTPRQVVAIEQCLPDWMHSFAYRAELTA